MVYGSQFVLLDLFWDSSRNGGTIEDVDPIVDDTHLYWWICHGCGKFYKSTVRRVLLDFKNVKSVSALNSYCLSCRMIGVKSKYFVNDIFKFIDTDYIDMVKVLYRDFLAKSSVSFTFYVFCPDCKSLHWANESTFTKRGSFCCKKCASLRKAVKTHGSVASVLPEVLPYYSSKNVLPANKLPVWRINCNDNKVYMVCPSCGIEHSKRMDAVINNGAFCGPCAKHKNSYRFGGSLYELYPEVASMFDGGGNTVSSKEISPGTHEVYRFKCSGSNLPEHFFEKDLSAVVAANKRGALGCPVCAGFEVQEGVNDFKSRVPDMASLWDYNKNVTKPQKVLYTSADKYYFICEKGHSFTKSLKHAIRDINLKSKGCPVCSGRKVVEGVNDLATLRPDILQYWNWQLNTISPYEVSVHSNKEAWFICANKGCNSLFKTSIGIRSATLGFCDDCRKRSWSISEKEVISLIRSWGFYVEEESHFLGGLTSFDIYIPEKKVAIEYNGLYWHSDKVRADKNYHYNKYKRCKDNGVSLIFIWEDDYLFKKDIVISMLKNKLGVSESEKINARDCEIAYVDYPSACEFLNKYHIQGKVSGSVYLSLKDSGGNIVAIAVLQDNSDGTVLLKRYCTSCNVRGGFSKILKCVEESGVYSGIVTFSDNGVSDGSLYSNNGFIAVEDLKPDYFYIVSGKRKHKFNYRLDRFKKDSNLVYVEGLSESELATLNKLARVWDAGKVKWFKSFK